MHRNLKNTLFVSAAAAGSGLVRLAEAQEVVEGGIAAMYGRVDEGPRGEAKSDFDSLLRSPNATGSFPVPGPSILSNSTATDTSEGWSWSISVLADLPISSTSEDSDEFYAGGKLVFNTPFSALNTSPESNDSVDEDWSICLYEWSVWGAPYPASLRTDNGTCSSVLSSECIAAIERKAASKHTSGRCKCPIARELPECDDLGDDNALWSTTCGANWYNSSSVRAWGDRGLEKITFGSPEAHERGNTTAYNYIGSVAWPVMVSFSDLRTGGLVTAKLSCPRAETATEGSVAPNAEGLDAGDGQGQNGGDDQSNQEGGGCKVDINWLIFGGFLIVSFFAV